MSAYVVWFVLAFALAIAELLTNTFYLLVLALAALVGGLVAWAGASVPLQLVVAAAIGLAGSIWLRRTRTGRLSGAAVALQNLDVGQSLRIDGWNDGRRTRASYRGAQWDVELVEGEQPVPGEFVIRAVQGNRLLVAARR